MVIFQRETIERELSKEELERERLRAIQGSDAWKQHAVLHKQAGLGDAQLHISGEPLFGGRDFVRERFGLEQTQKPVAAETPKKESTVSYGHTQASHVSYSSAGSQPDLWASCNCGAEFKAEDKEGKLEVKSYGVVGSDSKATAYAVTGTASYGTNKASSTIYKNDTSAAANY